MKILLVEDDKVISQMLAERLKLSGHNVDCVGNGSEALERIQASDFDFIVTDLEMPVLDGLEFTIQSRQLGFKMPFVLYTGAVSIPKPKLEEARFEEVFSKEAALKLIEFINNFKNPEVC